MKLSNKLLLGLFVIALGMLFFQAIESSRAIKEQKKEKIEKLKMVEPKNE